jgi:hypothetical protein
MTHRRLSKKKIPQTKELSGHGETDNALSWWWCKNIILGIK